MFFFQRIRSSLFFTSRSSSFSIIQVNVDIKIKSKERIGFVVGVLYLQRSGPLIIVIIIIILLWGGFGEEECNENCKRPSTILFSKNFVYKCNASLHVTHYWCSNLFIVKKPIVAHGVKADRLSSVRWKDIIHVHFTDPVILAA